LLAPAKIEQVLNNLISNTINFSYPGSSVEIHVSPEQDRLLLSVRDEGQGIPLDEIDNPFQWFGKTSVRSSEGESSSGFGLVIAHRIVGGIRARSGLKAKWDKDRPFTLRCPSNLN
jgi:signal transduction histidine kinase